MVKRFFSCIFIITILLSLTTGFQVQSISTLDFSTNGWGNPLTNVIKSSSIGTFDNPNYPYMKDDKGNPILKEHAGLDLGTSKEPVYAIADGYAYHVQLMDPNKTYNMSAIFIRHKTSNGDEFTAVYGHTYANGSILDNPSYDEAASLKGNMAVYVKKGQCIGTTTSYNIYHLHFGININPNIYTSGSYDGKTYGWGLDPLDCDLNRLGWRDPIEFLGKNFSKDTSLIIAEPTTSVIGIGTNTVNTEVYTINQANYFKLRDIAALLNNSIKQFGIIWDGVKNAITLKPGVVYATEGNELSISNNYISQKATPSSAMVYLDNQQLNVSAYTIGGYNYFKLRDIAAAINFGVDYDAESGKITINPLSDYHPAATPTLLSPSNGSTFKNNAPTLYWSSVSSPSGGLVEYFAETFDCPKHDESGWITSTSWTPSPTASGLYNWHVKSRDKVSGKESGWGNVWQYNIAAEYQPSDKPTLLSPSNGSSFKNSSPTLYWSSVSSPSGGLIEYWAETFDCPKHDESGWITSTSWTPSPTAPGLYNWHVKSRDKVSGKESGWGNVWQYTLGDILAPGDSQSITKTTVTVPTTGYAEVWFTPLQSTVYNYHFTGEYDIQDYWSLYNDQNWCIDDGQWREDASFSPPTLSIGTKYRLVIYGITYDTRQTTIEFSAPVQIKTN